MSNREHAMVGARRLRGPWVWVLAGATLLSCEAFLACASDGDGGSSAGGAAASGGRGGSRQSGGQSATSASAGGGKAGGAAGGSTSVSPSEACESFIDAWCHQISLSCPSALESNYAGEFGQFNCVSDVRNDTSKPLTVPPQSICSTVGDLGPTYESCIWTLTRSGEDVACPGLLDKPAVNNLPSECWEVYGIIKGKPIGPACTLQSRSAVPNADTCACVEKTCCDSANTFVESSNIGPYLNCYMQRCEGQEGCPPLGGGN